MTTGASSSFELFCLILLVFLGFLGFSYLGSESYLSGGASSTSSILVSTIGYRTTLLDSYSLIGGCRAFTVVDVPLSRMFAFGIIVVGI